METKNLLIIGMISFLFIGTIFFSGCSEDIQKYVDIGKDKLDDFTSSDKSDEGIECNSFCSADNYNASGVCLDLIDANSVLAKKVMCEDGWCDYNFRKFDTRKNEDVKCTASYEFKEYEFYCVCVDRVKCGSTIGECLEKCTINGCTG